jgi:inorganic pyrophosphatase
VIDIPQGAINKYEYDKKLQVFCLDLPLHSSVHYPGDYGFIAQTPAEDGEASIVEHADQACFI